MRVLPVLYVQFTHTVIRYPSVAIHLQTICCCCCCCHDEPVTHCLYGGTKNTPKRWGNPPDSKSGGIRLSLAIVDSHFIDWGITQGRLSLPTADVLSTIIVKWSMLTDVDKLSSCSRFSRLCSGFYRSKDPTNNITGEHKPSHFGYEQKRGTYLHRMWQMNW